MILYHFTSPMHWALIYQSGRLQVSESNIGSPAPSMQPCGEHVGPGVVWLLDTPEVAFDHGLTGSIVDKTEVRISVDVPRPIRWSQWEWINHMHPAWREALVERAGGPEAAEHWFVVPANVRARHWTEVRNVKTDEVLWRRPEVTA